MPGVPNSGDNKTQALSPGYTWSRTKKTITVHLPRMLSCCTVTYAQLHESDILHGKTYLIGSNLPLHRLLVTASSLYTENKNLSSGNIKKFHFWAFSALLPYTFHLFGGFDYKLHKRDYMQCRTQSAECRISAKTRSRVSFYYIDQPNSFLYNIIKQNSARNSFHRSVLCTLHSAFLKGCI